MENTTQEIESCCKDKKSSIKLFAFGLTLGLSLIAASALVSYSILGFKNTDNTISVSGSAKQKVSADSARWTARFSRTTTKEGLKAGYDSMKADEKTVKDFLTAQGFPEAEISPVFMNEVYNNDKGAPKEYSLSQDVEVKSVEPLKIKELAKNSESLANSGVLFQPNPVEYYYTKLPELRISLLPEAIKDAKARAGIIAQSSGSNVTTVKSVSMGVVQVMSEGSVDVSDYGSYDTSKIDKEVMVTVKATFGLK